MTNIHVWIYTQETVLFEEFVSNTYLVVKHINYVYAFKHACKYISLG